MTKYVNLEHAREDEQRKVMEDIVADKVCPFCPEHLLRFHARPVLYENDHWVLTENQWPYQQSQLHLLCIAKRHIISPAELVDDEWTGFGVLMHWACTEYNIPGGGLLMRFGESGYSGSTVQHLHGHLIVPPHHAAGQAKRISLWLGSYGGKAIGND